MDALNRPATDDAVSSRQRAFAGENTTEADKAGMEVVCCMALGDAQAAHHLQPLAQCEQISTLWVVRHRRVPGVDVPEVRYRTVASSWRIWRCCRIAWECLALARRPQVRLLISFNPFPYGLIALLVGRIVGKPVHIGFIGSDWYQKLPRLPGRCCLRILRSAWLTTVPGSRTVDAAIRHGFSPDRTAVLPHTIDVEQFPPGSGDAESTEFSCVVVGRLVRIKRVDLILEAFRQLMTKHPGIRLCIVGDGPLRNSLQKRAITLGITDNVTWTGYQSDVAAFLKRSRIILCASDSEGFPFALVEGLCAGLVPVTTDVGAIGDVIVHEQNGLHVPRGCPEAIATAVDRLLTTPDLYSKLRANILASRQQFRHLHATRVWSAQLDRLTAEPLSDTGFGYGPHAVRPRKTHVQDFQHRTTQNGNA